MKKMELLGLSVVTAALIVSTGCSSSDDDSSSGPSAPSEITQAVEMNVSVAQNAMALVSNNVNSLPELAPARVHARLAALKARSSEIGSGTQTYNCDVSGTYTEEWSYKTTGDVDTEPNKSWSQEDNYSESYDNCIDDYSGVNFVGDELDERIKNGIYEYHAYSEYNSETNQSKGSYSSSNTVLKVKRSTTTKATITDMSNDNMSFEITYDGIDEERTDINATIAYSLNGTADEMYHTDASGAKVAGIGERRVENFMFSSERVYTPAKSTAKLNINGFNTQYDTNSTGEHVIDGAYFSNYHVENTKMGDEETITISGTVGNKCLGGSITVSVDPIIKDNDILYHELPYSGNIVLSGSNKTAIEFSVDDDTASPKTTKATMSVDDGPATVFTTWSTLATGKCQDKK